MSTRTTTSVLAIAVVAFSVAVAGPSNAVPGMNGGTARPALSKPATLPVYKQPAPVVVGVQQVLAAADGRTIVAGEDHWIAPCAERICALMRAADTSGYKKLGLEVADHDHSPKHKGLQSYLKQRNLPGKKKHFLETLNAWKYIECALQMGWEVEAIDQYYWDWIGGNVFTRRDPAMASAIAGGGRMIAVPGWAHLKGMHDRLGDRVLIINSDAVPQKWHAYMRREFGADRANFGLSVPVLH